LARNIKKNEGDVIIRCSQFLYSPHLLIVHPTPDFFAHTIACCFLTTQVKDIKWLMILMSLVLFFIAAGQVRARGAPRGLGEAPWPCRASWPVFSLARLALCFIADRVSGFRVSERVEP
jgi:hypothetical protein